MVWVKKLRNHEEFAVSKRTDSDTWKSIYREPPLSQIQAPQDKVNSLSEEKEFCDPETASSSGVSHVPSQPPSIPSPRGMISRDSGLPHNTRNSMGTSRYVFEDPPAPKGPFPSFFKIPSNLTLSPCELRSGNTERAMRHGEGLRREPQSSTIPTRSFANVPSPLYHTGGTYSLNCMMETPRYTISELHFGKFPDSGDFQCCDFHFISFFPGQLVCRVFYFLFCFFRFCFYTACGSL